MLVRQAAEIATSLPSGKVSATEYYEIGTAMVNASNYTNAKKFFELAVQQSKEFNDEIGAIRSVASIEFVLGKPGDGRTHFQEALNIFAKYPEYQDPNFRAFNNVQTEMQWAGSEASINDFPDALAHNGNAQRIAKSLPLLPFYDQQRAQIADQLRQIQAGNTPSIGQTTTPLP